MKKGKKGLVGLLVLGLFIVAAIAVSQNSSSLQGLFTTKFSPLCGTSLGKTIYVQEGAVGAKTGTKAAPYDSIASAQSALETDSTIKRVCFSGALTGSLDLDAALPTSLTLTAYTAGASLESPDMVIHMETGVLDKLIVSQLELTGSMVLAPATSLTMNNLEVHGDGRENALWIGSTDTATVSNSSFDEAVVGIDTTHWKKDAVGSLTIDKVTFEAINSTAISAYNVDTLTVTGSTLSYDENGIFEQDVKSLVIQKNSFLAGGKMGVRMEDTTSTGTLDFQNNFVYENTMAFWRNGPLTSRTVTIYNNSFYNNYVSLGIYADVTEANNIVFTSQPWLSAYGSTTFLLSTTSDYNLFYGELAEEASTLAEWQTETGIDAHSRYGDPFFTSATDLHLFGSSSPAIDYGTDLSTVTVDIDGDARSSGSYDMGADEY